MEALIYLLGLVGQINDTPEYGRHKLFFELKERLHQKRADNLVLPCESGKQSKSLAAELVKSPRILASDLSRLSNSTDRSLLERIAEHPRTSPYTLSRLCMNQYKEVRQAVADNHATPYSAQLSLSQDRDPDVRYVLAENHHVCVNILEVLSVDENPFVSMRASRTLERLLNAKKVAIAA
ncbi:MAG: hypothetical protein K8F91_21100 [Candidatus Obscuribacterales bacterium]|nr:hypothetical protein [Candidatus Obscuribacterales bacterium]